MNILKESVCLQALTTVIEIHTYNLSKNDVDFRIEKPPYDEILEDTLDFMVFVIVNTFEIDKRVFNIDTQQLIKFKADFRSLVTAYPYKIATSRDFLYLIREKRVFSISLKDFLMESIFKLINQESKTDLIDTVTKYLIWYDMDITGICSFKSFKNSCELYFIDGFGEKVDISRNPHLTFLKDIVKFRSAVFHINPFILTQKYFPKIEVNSSAVSSESCAETMRKAGIQLELMLKRLPLDVENAFSIISCIRNKIQKSVFYSITSYGSFIVSIPIPDLKKIDPKLIQRCTVLNSTYDHIDMVSVVLEFVVNFLHEKKHLNKVFYDRKRNKKVVKKIYVESFEKSNVCSNICSCKHPHNFLRLGKNLESFIFCKSRKSEIFDPQRFIKEFSCFINRTTNDPSESTVIYKSYFERIDFNFNDDEELIITVFSFDDRAEKLNKKEFIFGLNEIDRLILNVVYFSDGTNQIPSLKRVVIKNMIEFAKFIEYCNNLGAHFFEKKNENIQNTKIGYLNRVLETYQKKIHGMDILSILTKKKNLSEFSPLLGVKKFFADQNFGSEIIISSKNSKNPTSKLQFENRFAVALPILSDHNKTNKADKCLSEKSPVKTFSNLQDSIPSNEIQFNELEKTFQNQNSKSLERAMSLGKLDLDLSKGLKTNESPNKEEIYSKRFKSSSLKHNKETYYNTTLENSSNSVEKNPSQTNENPCSDDPSAFGLDSSLKIDQSVDQREHLNRCSAFSAVYLTTDEKSHRTADNYRRADCIFEKITETSKSEQCLKLEPEIESENEKIQKFQKGIHILFEFFKMTIKTAEIMCTKESDKSFFQGRLEILDKIFITNKQTNTGSVNGIQSHETQENYKHSNNRYVSILEDQSVYDEWYQAALAVCKKIKHGFPLTKLQNFSAINVLQQLICLRNSILAFFHARRVSKLEDYDMVIPLIDPLQMKSILEVLAARREPLVVDDFHQMLHNLGFINENVQFFVNEYLLPINLNLENSKMIFNQKNTIENYPLGKYTIKSRLIQLITHGSDEPRDFNDHNDEYLKTGKSNNQTESIQSTLQYQGDNYNSHYIRQNNIIDRVEIFQDSHTNFKTVNNTTSGSQSVDEDISTSQCTKYHLDNPGIEIKEDPVDQSEWSIDRVEDNLKSEICKENEAVLSYNLESMGAVIHLEEKNNANMAERFIKSSKNTSDDQIFFPIPVLENHSCKNKNSGVAKISKGGHSMDSKEKNACSTLSLYSVDKHIFREDSQPSIAEFNPQSDYFVNAIYYYNFFIQDRLQALSNHCVENPMSIEILYENNLMKYILAPFVVMNLFDILPILVNLRDTMREIMNVFTVQDYFSDFLCARLNQITNANSDIRRMDEINTIPFNNYHESRDMNKLEITSDARCQIEDTKVSSLPSNEHYEAKDNSTSSLLSNGQSEFEYKKNLTALSNIYFETAKGNNMSLTGDWTANIGQLNKLSQKDHQNLDESYIYSTFFMNTLLQNIINRENFPYFHSLSADVKKYTLDLLKSSAVEYFTQKGSKYIATQTFIENTRQIIQIYEDTIKSLKIDTTQDVKKLIGEIESLMQKKTLNIPVNTGNGKHEIDLGFESIKNDCDTLKGFSEQTEASQTINEVQKDLTNMHLSGTVPNSVDICSNLKKNLDGKRSLEAKTVERFCKKETVYPDASSNLKESQVGDNHKKQHTSDKKNTKQSERLKQTLFLKRSNKKAVKPTNIENIRTYDSADSNQSIPGVSKIPKKFVENLFQPNEHSDTGEIFHCDESPKKISKKNDADITILDKENGTTVDSPKPSSEPKKNKNNHESESRNHNITLTVVPLPQKKDHEKSESVSSSEDEVSSSAHALDFLHENDFQSHFSILQDNSESLDCLKNKYKFRKQKINKKQKSGRKVKINAINDIRPPSNDIGRQFEQIPTTSPKLEGVKLQIDKNDDSTDLTVVNISKLRNKKNMLFELSENNGNYCTSLKNNNSKQCTKSIQKSNAKISNKQPRLPNQGLASDPPKTTQTSSKDTHSSSKKNTTTYNQNIYEREKDLQENVEYSNNQMSIPQCSTTRLKSIGSNKTEKSSIGFSASKKNIPSQEKCGEIADSESKQIISDIFSPTDFPPIDTNIQQTDSKTSCDKNRISTQKITIEMQNEYNNKQIAAKNKNSLKNSKKIRIVAGIHRHGSSKKPVFDDHAIEPDQRVPQIYSLKNPVSNNDTNVSNQKSPQIFISKELSSPSLKTFSNKDLLKAETESLSMDDQPKQATEPHSSILKKDQKGNTTSKETKKASKSPLKLSFKSVENNQESNKETDQISKKTVVFNGCHVNRLLLENFQEFLQGDIPIKNNKFEKNFDHKHKQRKDENNSSVVKKFFEKSQISDFTYPNSNFLNNKKVTILKKNDTQTKPVDFHSGRFQSVKMIPPTKVSKYTQTDPQSEPSDLDKASLITASKIFGASNLLKVDSMTRGKLSYDSQNLNAVSGSTKRNIDSLDKAVHNNIKFSILHTDNREISSTQNTITPLNSNNHVECDGNINYSEMLSISYKNTKQETVLNDKGDLSFMGTSIRSDYGTFTPKSTLDAKLTQQSFPKNCIIDHEDQTPYTNQRDRDINTSTIDIETQCLSKTLTSDKSGNLNKNVEILISENSNTSFKLGNIPSRQNIPSPENLHNNQKYINIDETSSHEFVEIHDPLKEAYEEENRRCSDSYFQQKCESSRINILKTDKGQTRRFKSDSGCITDLHNTAGIHYQECIRNSTTDNIGLSSPNHMLSNDLYMIPINPTRHLYKTSYFQSHPKVFIVTNFNQQTLLDGSNSEIEHETEIGFFHIIHEEEDVPERY